MPCAKGALASYVATTRPFAGQVQRSLRDEVVAAVDACGRLWVVVVLVDVDVDGLVATDRDVDALADAPRLDVVLRFPVPDRVAVAAGFGAFAAADDCACCGGRR